MYMSIHPAGYSGSALSSESFYMYPWDQTDLLIKEGVHTSKVALYSSLST